jgi:tRNA (guanine-N7-)-methyltransferase
MTSRRHPELDVSPVLLDPEAHRTVPSVNLLRLFDAERPVELEVGSGKGLFLINAAQAAPDHHFLGVELSRKYARLAAERIIRRGIANVRIWPGDARSLLARAVPDASVHAVHVYFPDPWWKKRHKKRRVVTSALVAEIVRLLEPGGRFHIATDVEEYFGVIGDLVAAEPALVATAIPEPRQPAHDLDYLTNFERKFRLEGRVIHRACYEKRRDELPSGSEEGS